MHPCSVLSLIKPHLIWNDQQLINGIYSCITDILNQFIDLKQHCVTFFYLKITPSK